MYSFENRFAGEIGLGQPRRDAKLAHRSRARDRGAADVRVEPAAAREGISVQSSMPNT